MNADDDSRSVIMSQDYQTFQCLPPIQECVPKTRSPTTLYLHSECVNHLPPRQQGNIPSTGKDKNKFFKQIITKIGKME